MNNYLNRVRNARLEYERAKLKIEELEAIATHMTANISDMPKGSASHGQTDESWAMLADYKSKYCQLLTSYVKEAALLEEELNCIRSSTIRTAMIYRYVDCLAIDKIASAMGYAVSWVDTLLAKGRRIYDKNYGYKDKEYEQ